MGDIFIKPPTELGKAKKLSLFFIGSPMGRRKVLHLITFNEALGHSLQTSGDFLIMADLGNYQKSQGLEKIHNTSPLWLGNYPQTRYY